MLHFFSHALDSQLTASPASFASLQKQFQGDQSSGLLHARLSPDRQLAILFVNGRLAFSFRLEPSGSHLLVPAALEAEWPPGGVVARILVAPSPAVRSVWQALEWRPPESQPLEARRFDGYLREHRRQKSSGLLYVTTPVSDGFLALWDGEVHHAEAIFDSPRGFEDASPLARRAQEAPAEAWKVEYYTCRPDSASGQQFVLRLALADWMSRTLAGYQHMVGQNLVINANYQLNTLARRHHLDIRSVGTTLIDRQFFLDRTQQADAYHRLLPHLLAQMGQVIGAGLARRIVDGALQAIHPLQRKAMQAAGLGADSTVWKL